MNNRSIKNLFLMFVFGAFLPFLLFGCGPDKAINSEIERPHWFHNPNDGGKMGGVGISGIHIRGLQAQRELAIERAINEIARQMGVKVSNFSKSVSVGNKDMVRTGRETYSIQTVNGTSVEAVIEELWTDPETNEFYVWMVIK